MTGPCNGMSDKMQDDMKTTVSIGALDIKIMGGGMSTPNLPNKGMI